MIHEAGMRTFGYFVAERRSAIPGLSQAVLGEKLGRDQKYVSNLERGGMANLPPLDILRRLAAALDCDVSDLLASAGYLDDPEPVEPPRRALLWAGMAEDFTEEENAIVDAVVETIRKNKGNGGA